jgi:hypothetical protein
VEVSTATIEFTPAERAEIKRRQREGEKLIARLAATETLEEQEHLADELWPQFDDWIRGRNRIQATPTRRPRLVPVIRPRTGQRAREHRPAATRRSSSSSSTSSSDPGEPAPASAPPGVPPRRGDLRNTHDRLEVLRRDLSSAIALLRRDDLAAVRLRAALDIVDDLLRDLERFGVAS